MSAAKRLPIPAGVFDQHTAVLGKTRSGKSSVMRLLVERLLERGEPVCIIDPKGDWYGLRLSADGKGPGFDVVIFGDPALAARVDVAINDQVGADVAELLATGNRPALIDLGGWTVGARTRFYVDFAEAMFRHTTGDRWIVIDEIHNFAPKGSLKGTERDAMPKALHWTNRLASEGLGKGIHLIFASQRPQKVHNDTLTSAETLIAMRVLHPSDRGAVSDWIAAAGDQSGKDVLDSLADLARGEGWAWSPEIKFGPTRIQFPLFSTYDSFKAQKREAAALKGWGDVNLGEINAKLARVQEQKKADDPRELRKQLAAVKAELAAKERVLAQVDTQTKRIEQKLERVSVKEKPVLKDGQLARLEKVYERMLKEADRHLEDATRHRDAMLQLWEQQADEAKALLRVLADIAGSPLPKAEVISINRPQPPNVQREIPETLRAAPPAPRQVTPRQPRANSNGSGSLGKSERAILTVLAQHPDGCEKGKLTLLSGYSWTGTFRTYLSALRTAGYIVGDNSGTMRITDAGLEALGDYTPLPSGPDLAEYWINNPRFNSTERDILRVLLAHPRGLTADKLCDQIGKEWSGTLRTYLSNLRTAGVVVGRNNEAMRANDELLG